MTEEDEKSGPVVETRGVDIAEIARTATRQMAQEEKERLHREGPRSPDDLEGTFYVLVTHHGEGQYSAETVGRLPHNLDTLRTVGRSPEQCARTMHRVYANALSENLIIRDRMTVLKVAARARFPIIDIVPSRLVVL